MRAECSIADLRAAVSFCQKWTMPRVGSLASVRIAAGGALTLECSNLDVWAATSSPATVENCGIALPPAADLAAFCRFAPKTGTCTLAMDGTALKVSCGAARATFPTAPEDGFPSLPAPIEMREVDAAFSEALRFCAPAMSSDQSRYYLNGALLDGDRVISSDGHRLHSCGSGPIPSDAIIPRLAVPEVSGMLADGGRLGCSADMWSAQAGGSVLAGKLVAGPFPANAALVIKNALDGQCVALCDREELMLAVKRASLGGDHGLSIKGADGRITAALAWRKGTKIEAAGEADCLADVKSEFTAGINSRYLLDALSVLPDAEVEVLHVSPFMTLRPANRSAFLDCFATITEFRL